MDKIQIHRINGRWDSQDTEKVVGFIAATKRKDGAFCLCLDDKQLERLIVSALRTLARPRVDRCHHGNLKGEMYTCVQCLVEQVDATEEPQDANEFIRPTPQQVEDALGLFINGIVEQTKS